MEQAAAALEAADDRIVAGRAADGDPAAFAVLVRRFAPLMHAYARRILPGSAEIDDVVQETFITAWQRIPELEDLSRVKSWLMRITGRTAIDHIRSTRKQVALDQTEQAAPERAGPQRQAEARAGMRALRAALADLPEAQRQVWVLRELGGSSYEEIASDLDLTVSTVRGLLARARKHIIVRMEQWR